MAISSGVDIHLVPRNLRGIYIQENGQSIWRVAKKKKGNVYMHQFSNWINRYGFSCNDVSHILEA